MPDVPSNLTGVVLGIRRRAAFARTSAFVILFVLTVLGIGTAFAFVQAASGPTISIGPQTSLTNSLIQTSKLEWVPEITKAFIRIAGVILVVFLINILVSFARYSLKVANYLDFRADALEITNGEIEQLVALLPSISVDPLDFMKIPTSPFDTYLSTIRSVLPGRIGTATESGHRKPKLEE